MLASTLAYYPGETMNISNELNTTDLVYTIIDNSTPITLDVNSTNEYVWFTIPYDITPQTFTVVFVPKIIEEKTVTQTVTIHSGGSSKTKIIEKNNTIYLNDTRYYPIESECPICSEVETEVPEETEESVSYPKDYLLLSLFCALVIVLLIIWGANERKKRIKNSRQNEFNKSTKEELKE
jgi:hypothetical protein